MRKLLLLISFLVLSSCSTFEVYPKKIAEITKKTLTNTPTDIEKYFKTTNQSDNNFLLNTQEAGRLAFIQNDYNNSLKYFNISNTIYNQQNDQAQITLQKGFDTAIASTVLNDKSIKYDGSTYEAALIHLYLAMNYLLEKDFSRAMIEIRKSQETQKYAESLREQEINKIENKIQNYTFSKDATILLQQSAALRAQTKDKFLNSYIYYFSGQIRELLGESNNAYIDYKKALELAPNNYFIHQDLMRLSKVWDPTYYHQLAKQQTFDNSYENYNQKKTIIVFYEQGFIQAKQAMRGDVLLYNVWTSFSLPYYPANNIKINEVNASINNTQGRVIAKSKGVLLANLGTLAKYDLAERYPMIIARLMSRLILRTSAQLQSTTNDTNNPLSTAVQVLGVLGNITEQADLRSWLLLPQYVQVFKINTSNNFENLNLSINHQRTFTLSNLRLNNGEIAVIHLIDTGETIYSKVIYQGKKLAY